MLYGMLVRSVRSKGQMDGRMHEAVRPPFARRYWSHLRRLIFALIKIGTVLEQTHLPTSNRLNPWPVKARSYTPSFGATKARTYPALIRRSRCSSDTMRCFGRCFSSSRERNSSGVRRWRGTDNNPRSNLLIFSLRVLCRTVRAQDRSQTWLKRRSFVKKRNVRVWPEADICSCTEISAARLRRRSGTQPDKAPKFVCSCFFLPGIL